MMEERNKELSDNFVVSFKAEPHNEVSVSAGDEILGYMNFPGRNKALDVYRSITSSKDARNFIKIVQHDFDPEQDLNGRRSIKLMKVIGV